MVSAWVLMNWHSVGDLPEHGLARVAEHFILLKRGAALPPDGDAFEERSRFVVTGISHAQGGVEVQMRVDEGRRRQVAPGVDLTAGLNGEPFSDRGHQAVTNRYILRS